jgi:hypothetical protein
MKKKKMPELLVRENRLGVTEKTTSLNVNELHHGLLSIVKILSGSLTANICLYISLHSFIRMVSDVLVLQESPTLSKTTRYFVPQHWTKRKNRCSLWG